jgi:protocatechuate 3,4-dioxygenase beta subunit
MSDDRALSRREALGLLGAAGAAALTVPSALAGATPPALALASLDCVVTPAQAEGPYFVDEKLARADIRRDPTTGVVSAGAPLALRVAVARVDGASCAPVRGAIVDVWQCDALGVYSDVNDRDGRFDTRGKKFLRGHQVTDRAGVVRFTTVYPGWYGGRTPHIHFKVRVPGASAGRAAHEFTSQWYFNEAVTDAVYAKAPYAGRGARDTTNARDGIFRRERGSDLLLAVRESPSGYEASFSVGLRMA